jgi:hypothetical protein
MHPSLRPVHPAPIALTLTLVLASPACVAGVEGTDDAAFEEPAADAEVDLGAHALAEGTLKLNDVYYVPKRTGRTDAPMYTTGSSQVVVRRVPQWASVKVVIAEPSASGRYRVDHAGTLGWMHGGDLALHHRYRSTLSLDRIDALASARKAMGFSYWWSNARWTPTGATTWPVDNRGDCKGKCGEGKGCTHEATGGGEEYGSDCSGLVSTVWGLDDFDPDTNPENNGYATVAFNRDSRKWRTIPFSQVVPGDAVVRHDAGRKHIVLIAARLPGDNAFRVYECAGCDYGCRPWRYTFEDGGPWHAIRRTGW